MCFVCPHVFGRLQTNYTRRKSYQEVFGREFDSPRVHRKRQIPTGICLFQLNPPLRVGEILLCNVKYAYGVWNSPRRRAGGFNFTFCESRKFHNLCSKLFHRERKRTISLNGAKPRSDSPQVAQQRCAFCYLQHSASGLRKCACCLRNFVKNQLYLQFWYNFYCLFEDCVI